MTLKLVVCCLLFVLPHLYAQYRLDTSRAIVGEQAVLSLINSRNSFRSGDTVRISALLRLGNPSVWYPEILQTPDGLQTIRQVFQRQNDSTWRLQYNVRLNNSVLDTMFKIRGKTLAGYDSLCTVLLDSLIIQEKPYKPLTGLIQTRTLATPRLFIRFADLLPSFPHPSHRNEPITWIYNIDLTSDITFRIYDLTGKEVVVFHEGQKTPGTHRFTLVPGKWKEHFTATVYWIRLQSNTGEAVQRFWISE